MTAGPIPDSREDSAGAARAHAHYANRLLAGVRALSEHLDNLTPDQRLQMHAMGGNRKVNADMEWTVQLAQAHALTALALRETRP